jgi:hypothetical protein
MSDREGYVNPDQAQWWYSLSLALAISRRHRLEPDLMGSRRRAGAAINDIHRFLHHAPPADERLARSGLELDRALEDEDDELGGVHGGGESSKKRHYASRSGGRFTGVCHGGHECRCWIFGKDSVDAGIGRERVGVFQA